MLPDKEPLVLKDELAKMAREASPERWLKDACAEIEAWRTTMPGTERAKLTAEIRSDEAELELRCNDGWGKIAGFALYVVERGAVRFYPGQPEMMPNTTLASEQAFIEHLLQVLRAKLALHR